MRAYNWYLRRLGVRLEGDARYVSPRARLDGTDYSLISLGEECVISSDVRILTHDFSVARIRYLVEGHPDQDEEVLVREVNIGNNSFVGAFSILLPGTTVGKDCIVGAGSVVRGRLPDGAITLGNPAEIIGSVYDRLPKRSDDDRNLDET